MMTDMSYVSFVFLFLLDTYLFARGRTSTVQAQPSSAPACNASQDRQDGHVRPPAWITTQRT